MGNAAAPAKGSDPEPQGTHHAQGLGNLFEPTRRSGESGKKSRCCTCLKIAYVVLCVVAILKSIAMIAVTISTAIAIKVFSREQSGRLVAMIILAVTAAIALSMIIYAMVAVLTNRARPVHAASVVLIILAIIQAVIIGSCVRVSNEDEMNLSRAISESFALAREDNPRHVKMWSAVQFDLTCCGVYGAEDYRNPTVPKFFAPDIPISCCPSFDPDRSELVQEREREGCKARKEFFDVGCRSPIIEVYRDTSKYTLAVTCVTIFLMIFISIIGAILTKKRCLGSEKTRRSEDAPDLPPDLPQITVKPKSTSSSKSVKS